MKGRAAPMLTDAPWSKGRYDSFKLLPNGSLTCTIHPPGLAWGVNNDDTTIPDEMTFLSSRNQQCRGRWYVAALLSHPFRSLCIGSYSCQLILVMGVKVTVDKLLMKRKVNIYYYKMKSDLSDSAISDLIKTGLNPKQFVTHLFESSLIAGTEKTTQRIRLLNQISGPMLHGWNLSDSTIEVDGRTYHQCRLGPDQWLNRGRVHNDSEFGIELTNTCQSLWKPHPHHKRTECNDDVAVVTGTNTISQYDGSHSLVVFTTRKESCGRYMWMPLPKSPSGHQDFALITIDQKVDIDNMFTVEEEELMEPQEFRDMVIDMTIENGFDSFVRLRVLSCGTTYFGKRCMMFIVSIVSDSEMKVLRAKNTSSIVIDDDEETCFEIIDSNIQDPLVNGVVVFRGNVFPKVCPIGLEEVGLVMSAYHTSTIRYRTSNQGHFQMTKERQSSMASRNMGVCGNSSQSHYYNESNNNAVKPFTSPLSNVLNTITTNVQNSSGQVVIGLVKKAHTSVLKSHIGSDDVCPYGIWTGPRHDKEKGVLESFSNCGHRDTTDCTNTEQGHIVLSYLQTMTNSTVVMEYLQRMYSIFSDVLVSPCISFPTTCAWMPIEDPDEYSYKHISYFVVVDAGIAWDLSSDVFSDEISTISGTFFGKLVEHCTCCSLYVEKSSGGVTTLCPGNACNVAWGTSGGSNKLKLKAATLKALKASKTGKTTPSSLLTSRTRTSTRRTHTSTRRTRTKSVRTQSKRKRK